MIPSGPWCLAPGKRSGRSDSAGAAGPDVLELTEPGTVVSGQPVTGGVVFEPPPLLAHLSKALEERAEQWVLVIGCAKSATMRTKGWGRRAERSGLRRPQAA